MDNSLIESNESFRLLATSDRDYAVFILDPVGKVVSWNAGAKRITGYDELDVLGRHFSVFYTEQDRANDIPAQELIVAKSGYCEAEGWRVRKNGTAFSAYVSITPLFDENHQLLGFAKVTRDVSGQRNLVERFRKIVDSAPNAMVMINAQGVIEMVNYQAEKLFGYLRSEMLGQPVEKLIPHRLQERHPSMRISYFSEPQSRPMGKGRDLYALRKDGTEFPVEIGLNPIETEEGTKVVSAIVDISDRKQKEEKIEAALVEKDVLLGEIHHRVKNNLQIVHSLLDLQSMRMTDEYVLNMLRDSQNRIRSMALIHQSLYQSKDFAQVHFNSVLESLVPSIIESYQSHRYIVDFTIDAQDVRIPLNLAVPCGLIVNELITNALKHAFPDQTEGHIVITLKNSDKGAYLEVSDNGVGIPATIDLDDAETLGLQLVNILASQLGTRIDMQKANPTKFSLTIPFEH